MAAAQHASATELFAAARCGPPARGRAPRFKIAHCLQGCRGISPTVRSLSGRHGGGGPADTRIATFQRPQSHSRFALQRPPEPFSTCCAGSVAGSYAIIISARRSRRETAAWSLAATASWSGNPACGAAFMRRHILEYLEYMGFMLDNFEVMALYLCTGPCLNGQEGVQAREYCST